ncbi:MAG: hypothetical protein IIY81_12585 [Lachnospiraceae bacterium]|nr:hypothetical protein [Lachnospiraceae bacterium]
MSLPLSVLENVLHPKQISFDENYLIELNNGELVTLGDLTNFWIEGHQKIKKALDIIKESKKEVCNTTGENTLTQSQTTGKKSKKSTKKTTTSQE